MSSGCVTSPMLRRLCHHYLLVQTLPASADLYSLPSMRLQSLTQHFIICTAHQIQQGCPWVVQALVGWRDGSLAQVHFAQISTASSAETLDPWTASVEALHDLGGFPTGLTTLLPGFEACRCLHSSCKHSAKAMGCILSISYTFEGINLWSRWADGLYPSVLKSLLPLTRCKPPCRLDSHMQRLKGSLPAGATDSENIMSHHITTHTALKLLQPSVNVLCMETVYCTLQPGSRTAAGAAEG